MQAEDEEMSSVHLNEALYFSSSCIYMVKMIVALICTIFFRMFKTWENMFLIPELMKYLLKYRQ
ncbi:hypothetical protein X975_23657, partial [Stegodyphus mimosarum]